MLSILGDKFVPVIRHADARRTATPNAVMTTLASPTQGGSSYAVWRVDMNKSQAGPLHAVDTEQIWTVLEGQATVDLDGELVTICEGDTIVMPADSPRQVAADTDFAAIVSAPAHMQASVVSESSGGDKLTPGWVQ